MNTKPALARPGGPPSFTSHLRSLSGMKLPRGTRRGFTLTEVLVVILIIAVLAALLFTVTKKSKLAAAKSKGVDQMRGIGVAVFTWVADNGGIEPFYYSNTTGDYPNETLAGPTKWKPGNPARALYNKNDPDSGYVRNPEEFFSPLVDSSFKPTRQNYDPAGSPAWGTYAWFHPFCAPDQRTSRAAATMFPSDNPGKVNPRISNNYLMSESYASNAGLKPAFDKDYYHALMGDCSVTYVGDGPTYSKWKTGQ